MRDVVRMLALVEMALLTIAVLGTWAMYKKSLRNRLTVWGTTIGCGFLISQAVVAFIRIGSPSVPMPAVIAALVNYAGINLGLTLTILGYRARLRGAP